MSGQSPTDPRAADVVKLTECWWPFFRCRDCLLQAARLKPGDDERTEISKKISWILRHGAKKADCRTCLTRDCLIVLECLRLFWVLCFALVFVWLILVQTLAPGLLDDDEVVPCIDSIHGSQNYQLSCMITSAFFPKDVRRSSNVSICCTARLASLPRNIVFTSKKGCLVPSKCLTVTFPRWLLPMLGGMPLHAFYRSLGLICYLLMIIHFQCYKWSCLIPV